MCNEPADMRALGVARLVDQVQKMVPESGNSARFDAASWVAEWLEEPLPAFDNRKPASFLDTADGQATVIDLVARMRSGVHS